ncbi:sensor histidine kinase [Paenibacillus psychroresistens]|uniref:Sensor histidine kinase n=1 Tax=Paenibacillus psychroresistens TaxID=1778678 RepID=A0A6B8RG43_9BACL|nr:sensor histidine kinase [Paenibacillus psychroresistens]QGQ95150.1 sensor histidine kinase [Paenibacillus psychroresistens]
MNWNHKFRSLFIKGLLVITLLFFCPFIAMSFIVYQQITKNVKNEISTVNQNSLFRIREMIDTVFQQAERLASELSEHPEIQEFMQSSTPEQYINEVFRSIDNSIKMFNPTFPFIHSIYIYSGKEQYVISNRRTGYVKFSQDLAWDNIRTSLDDSASETWNMSSFKENSKSISLIRLNKPVKHAKTEKSGTLFINLDITQLEKFIGRANPGLTDNFLIVDQVDKVIYSNHKNAEEYKEEPWDGLTEGGSVIKKIDGRIYFVSAITSVTNWKYISIAPLRNFQDKINGLRLFLTVFFIVGAAVILLVSYIVARRTYRPIQQILHLMENPIDWIKADKSKGDLRELSFLAENITSTMTSNLQLEQQLDDRNAAFQKLQLAALQSQINPLFLYTTLETIRLLAGKIIGANNEVSTMLMSLSDLVGNSLNAESHLISLESEINHVQHYVQIMKYRYKDKLNVNWAIDPTLLNNKIVQISLQPIIENAIYHGIKPKRKKGNIWIRTRDITNDLLIEIQDDGIGMSSECLKDLNNRLANNSEELAYKNIGLFNVNQRMKLIFGNNYGITLTSEVNVGTCVRIWFPKLT